jgi:hypothetical protein
MRLYGMLVVTACCLVAADSPTGEGLIKEVATLRERVKFLETRLAAIEHSLKLPQNAAAKPLGKVGQIFIMGNTETPESVILAQLPFFPGSSFSQADLDLAARRLELLDIFVVDVVNGIHPTVKRIDDIHEFTDILIEVKEKRPHPRSDD